MKMLVRLLVLVFGTLSLPLLHAQPAATGKTAKASATVEALVKTLTASQNAALLHLLNQGDAAGLEAISGIGHARAAAIMAARPFADVADVMRVPGVGEGTFAKMVAHAQEGFPQERQPKKKAAAPAK